MSLHSQRFLRLVRLREQQHLLTTMELRAALHVRHEEEESLAAMGKQMQSSLNDLRQAQHDSSAHDWLMACADIELCRVAAQRHDSRRVGAQKSVDDAAKRETEARTASKQMERSFEHARTEEVHAALRAEQVHLDEVARNLRRFSGRQPSPEAPI